MRRLVVFVVLLACALPVGGAAAGRATDVVRRGAQAAAAQPEIRVVDLKGLEAAVARNRGKAVLVNFWAIWCEPCVAELPEFLATGREYRDRNAVVLTVSYDLMIPDVTKDEVLKKMRAFVAERKIDAPVLIYDALDYDAINARFGLPGPVPATIAIDAAGRIVDRHAGQATRQQFQEMMRKAIGSSE
jgi:thiol-disulfide isomerase/thioredoxin